MLMRLNQLKEEFQKGQEQMAMLDRKRAEVHAVLLRISGAIQVLEELVADQQHQQCAGIGGD